MGQYRSFTRAGCIVGLFLTCVWGSLFLNSFGEDVFLPILSTLSAGRTRVPSSRDEAFWLGEVKVGHVARLQYMFLLCLDLESQ